MKNVIIKSNSGFFNLTNVVGVNVLDSKEKWYKFKKNRYKVDLVITYDERDFSENKTYTYTYKTKKDRDTVIKRFLDMDFDDFKKCTPTTIEFDFAIYE